MIELLAAVVILGILSVIAIGSVQRILDKSEDEYYLNQEENIVAAAQTYYQNNRKQLPKSIGQERKVTLKTLQEKKYISKVTSKNKKTCSPNDTYVEVLKYSQTEYKYKVHLDCGSEYITKTTTKTELPTATISYPTGVDIEKTIKGIKAKISLTGGKDSEDNSNLKLMSYSYIIYHKAIETDPYQEVYSSGSKGTRKETQDFFVKLDEYLPGYIKIQVTAINENGEKVTVSAEKNYKDALAPLCPDKNDSNYAMLVTGENTDWNNSEPSRTITIICKDQENGSECARPYYTQTFTGEAKTGIITMYDKAGNPSNCTVDLYMDKTKPTITVNIRKKDASGDILNTYKVEEGSTTTSFTTGWYNSNYSDGIYIEYIVEDAMGLKQLSYARNASGLKASSSNVNTYQTPTVVNLDSKTTEKGGFKITADGYHKTKFSLTDLSGKTTTLELTTPYDKTKPNCGTITATGTKGKIDGKETGWYISAVKLSANDGSDAMSGHHSSSVDTTSISSTTTEKKVTLTTKDVAGNKCTTSSTYKVDLDKPYISIDSISAGNYTSMTSNGSCVKTYTSDGTCTPSFKAGSYFYYYITFTAHDTGSGVKRKETIWTHNGTSSCLCGNVSSNTWVPADDGSCAYCAGTRISYFHEYKRAVDNAGNIGPKIIVKGSVTW